jgi:lipopolysaccharide transport system permease protein
MNHPNEQTPAIPVTVISPKVHPLEFPDLLRFRYLIYLFVKRDFIIYYQQTILGPLWYLIQPLASTTVLALIFGKIARLPTDEIHPFLFYFSGTIAWGYFASCFTQTSQTLIRNAREFGNAPFPRLTVPVATVISALVRFFLQGMLFIVLFLLLQRNGIVVPHHIFLLPLAILQLALLGGGSGIAIAAVTSKYRDFSHLLGFFVQMWYFCTPVVYPLSLVPEKQRIWFILNPMTSVIESFRRAFFSTSSITMRDYLFSWGITMIVCIAGLIIFNTLEKSYIDTV